MYPFPKSRPRTIGILTTGEDMRRKQGNETKPLYRTYGASQNGTHFIQKVIYG